MKCHRCGEPMTLYVVGRDYCVACIRDLAKRAQEDARRRVVRFARAKDLSPWGGAA